MSWRSSELIERLGIRICFSGGIGDGSDPGGFGGDAGGYGGDGDFGGDMGGDVSGNMGGDFSGDSYGGDAGLGTDGYGSDMGVAADGYGADGSDSSYSGDIGMDGLSSDVDLGSSMNGDTDGDYSSDVGTVSGDLNVDAASLSIGDTWSGYSAEVEGGALASGVEDNGLVPAEINDNFAVGSIAPSDMNAAGVPESYTSDLGLGLAGYTVEPNLPSASSNVNIVSDPSVVPDTIIPDSYNVSSSLEIEDYTGFNAGFNTDDFGISSILAADVVPPVPDAIDDSLVPGETFPLSETVVEANLATVVRDTLIGIGIGEVYGAAKDAVVDAFKNGQAKPDQVDIMGNPNPALPSIFDGAPETPNSKKQNPTASPPPGSTTDNLTSPNSLGTAYENLDQNDRSGSS
jgi:hypothetical protein